MVVTLISNLNLAWKFEFPIDSQMFWFLWNETFVIRNNVTFQFGNVICYSNVRKPLLFILRNFVDNISISYLFLKLLTQKFFDRGLHFSATNVKMFLKIVEFIAFFGFNKLFWKCFWILLIQGLEYLILSTMGSSSLYFQRSLLRSL